MNKLPKSLYIHIPFCSQICSYCDFPKLLAATGFQTRYLDALEKELFLIPNNELNTIYIGGGTPTSLSDMQLEGLLNFVSSRFHAKKEYTIEANPESLTPSKIDLIKKYGINRVSLGVQSFKKESLRLLNRSHSKEDVINAVHLLQQSGIDNINLDFIFGLKEESTDDINENISIASELKVKHISYYSLQIEKGTKLFKTPEVCLDDDGLADDYSFIVEKLAEKGYRRYEVSNFSVPGFESVHNLTYWHNEPYYAAGLGATSYVDGTRIKRTLNISKYLQSCDAILETSHEDMADQEFNYLMLNLRLESGFSLKEFFSRYHHSFLTAYANEIKRLSKSLVIGQGRVCVAKDKFFVLDAILVDLLHFKKE